MCYKDGRGVVPLAGIRPIQMPLLGYGMITYTSDNPLIRVIPNQ